MLKPQAELPRENIKSAEVQFGKNGPDWQKSAEDAWRTGDDFNRFHMLELCNLPMPSGLHYAAETWEELPESLRADLARVAEEMGKRR